MEPIDFIKAKQKKTRTNLVNELLDVVLQGKVVSQGDEAELKALLEAITSAFESQSLSFSFNLAQTEEEAQAHAQEVYEKIQGRIIALTLKNYCKNRGITAQPKT